MKTHGLVGLMLACAISLQAIAGIPEPSNVLYGTVSINGQPVGAGEDVTVIARVAGSQDPVGTYHMGANPQAGDNYVLPIRIESLADGSTQSRNAAIVGDTVEILLQQGTGTPEVVDALVISARGVVASLALSLGGTTCLGDLDGDGDTDLADLGILLADFGCMPPPNCVGDLDGDGDTDLADLGILLADFGCEP